MISGTTYLTLGHLSKQASTVLSILENLGDLESDQLKDFSF